VESTSVSAPPLFHQRSYPEQVIGCGGSTRPRVVDQQVLGCGGSTHPRVDQQVPSTQWKAVPGGACRLRVDCEGGAVTHEPRATSREPRAASPKLPLRARGTFHKGTTYPLIFRDQVHLVDKAEDLGIFRVLGDRGEARLEVMVVLLQLPRFDVKDLQLLSVRLPPTPPNPKPHIDESSNHKFYTQICLLCCFGIYPQSSPRRPKIWRWRLFLQVTHKCGTV
jgi:hypothetical protein